MKKTITLIFFFIISNSFSQDEKRIELQKERYEFGIQCMNDSMVSKALRMFYLANILIPDTEYGKKSFKKIDSIKPYIRTKLKENIKGVWIKTESGSNWGFTKTNDFDEFENIIEITENEINFYIKNRKTNDKNLLKTEQIKFNEHITGFNISYTDFIFSDNQIWSFNINESDNLLHSINIGDINENEIAITTCGNSEIYYKRIK